MTDEKRLAALESRIAALEARRTPEARRALEDLKRSCPSWRRRWVAADYYDWPMEKRAATLQVEIPQMCKSMLLENKNGGSGEPFDAKYYLVVVQYAATFNAMGLRTILADKAKKPKNKFNFRVADPQTCKDLTGYDNGAVTPFGITDIPIVLAEACTLLDVIWMGGGHTQLKFGCSVHDFIQRHRPLILNVSDPR